MEGGMCALLSYACFSSTRSVAMAARREGHDRRLTRGQVGRPYAGICCAWEAARGLWDASAAVRWDAGGKERASSQPFKAQ